jgi:hypothetical protein
VGQSPSKLPHSRTKPGKGDKNQSNPSKNYEPTTEAKQLLDLIISGRQEATRQNSDLMTKVASLFDAQSKEHTKEKKSNEQQIKTLVECMKTVQVYIHFLFSNF